MNGVDYLNENIWATLRPSEINGVGVFALRDIPKGQRITDHSVHNIKNYTMCVVKTKDFNLIVPEVRQLILDRNMFQDWQENLCFYSPNSEQTLQSFCNHSNAPNSEGMVALRDIKKDEEITQDYRKMFQGHEPHKLIKQHHAYV